MSNGKVSMYRTTGQTWEVLLPDGSMLNTALSATCGLQEAINYSCTYQYHLEVMGGGIAYASYPQDHSIITCTTPVVVPPTTAHSIEMRGVTISFEGISGPAITIDSADMLDFSHSGQIVYRNPINAAPVVYIKPTTGNQEDGFIGFTSSKVTFGDLVCADAFGYPQSVSGVGVMFSYESGIIINNKFDFGLINGGVVGLQINTSPTHSMVRNKITSNGLTAQGDYCANFGISATNNILDNEFEAPLFTNTGTHLLCFGQYNNFRVKIPGGSGVGVNWGTGASGNTMYAPRIVPTTQATGAVSVNSVVYG